MKLFERLFLVLLIITGFLPAFSAIDKMTIQWLYVSLIIIFYFIFKLLYNRNDNTFPVVLNYSLISFIGLLFIALISFVSSDNLSESIIEYTRLILIFSLLLVYFSIASNLQIEQSFVFKIFSYLLLIECLFFFFNLFFKFSYYGIIDFKGISSNVNIQSFSVLLKLPLLLFAFNYKYISRFLFYPIIVLSTSIIFLISSRAALFGLFFIFIFFILNAKLDLLRRLSSSLLSLITAFVLTFLLIIPKLGTSSKIGSLELVNSSTLSRLSYYQEALMTIYNFPLFGVGLGNWKIFGIGTHQNFINAYTTPYHVHNDFLQFGAEIGVLGFLFFSFFLFFIFIYIIKYQSKGESGNLYFPLLLSFLIYILDSSLNFPISRPLIQTQFLLMIAVIFYFNRNKFNTVLFKRVFIFPSLCVMLVVFFCSFKVYDSYVKQNSLLNDFNKLQFVTPINYIESIDDDFPNITATALPIKAIKANYYKKDSVVSRLLDLAIKDNPYIKYPQALKSIRFKEKGMLDSSLHYAKDAFTSIPNNELHAISYLSILTALKDSVTLDSVFYATKSLKSSNIWNAYLSDLIQIGVSHNRKYDSLFKNSKSLFPSDKRFEFLNRLYFMGDSLINQTKKIFSEATLEFNNKNFLNSAKLYLEGSRLDSTDSSFLENAGHAFYLNKNKDKALKLFDSVINYYPKSTGKAYYFKGLITIETSGNISESCRLFYMAKKRGNTDADKAIKLFCK